MIIPERRRENRVSCNLRAGVFLGKCPEDPRATDIFWGELTSLSRLGAGIALDEIMAGRIHLAYGPMEADAFCLNLVLPLDTAEAPLVLPVRPIWFNKEHEEGIPPFRIGLEFSEPISSRLLKQISAHIS